LTVTPGISAFLAEHAGRLRGARVALLAGPASVLPDLGHTLDALLAAGLDVVAVLGPEHGFRGSMQAGFAERSGVDPATGVPVIDAYDRPMDEALAEAGAQVVIADLQNAGVRFYTYESSLHDLIGAAARTGTQVIVCDRPNPVTGATVAGPVLDLAYASFVGRAPIPLRHGMTTGELALLFAARQDAGDLVQVAPMAGWRRDAWFDDTGLPWVPPSPNLPTVATALCYPGTCLMEGTNLSVGRGTTTPFELIGAPWVTHELARRLRALDLPGVAFREAYTVPQFNRFAGQPICGVEVHVTDRRRFEPLRVALEILAATGALWPEQLAFSASHFDRLAGSARLREALQAGTPPTDIVAGWQAGLADFAPVRAEHLLYKTIDPKLRRVKAAGLN
jgi:uncharacterized protein YbbC (DUF1343 family)